MHVSPNGATIVGHVDHISFYLAVLADCIQKKPVEQLDWQDSWKLQEMNDVQWGETKQKLRDAHQTTLTVMRNLEEWEGEDDIGASLAILSSHSIALGCHSIGNPPRRGRRD